MNHLVLPVCDRIHAEASKILYPGGKEKAVAAFKAYNDSANDYYKSFDRITAIKMKTGEIVVEWTENLYD